MKSKYPIKKLILLNFWLTSYFFLFGFVTTMASQGITDIKKAIANSLIAAVLLILNAFLNLGLLLFFENKLAANRAKHKRRYLFLSYSLNFIVYSLVVIVYAAVIKSSVHLSSFIFIIASCILINSLILVLQNFILLHDAKVNSDIENSRLRAANVDAANQLLRQQIHPHFLFNALNILKSLYKINPKGGEEYLIRLSDFLRAAVSHNNIKVITLKDEIKLSTDYLEMQRIRFGNALIYSISVEEDKLNVSFVPSFSIQPLLENAIKHNELTEESPLHIQIQQEGDRIKVSNNIKLKSTREAPTGFGLTNLTERYRLLSNDELFIEETSERFSVSIKILDKEFSTTYKD